MTVIRRLEFSHWTEFSSTEKRRLRCNEPNCRKLRIERLEARWMLAADLIVEDLWTEPATVLAGEDFTIFARIRNQGDTNANAGLFANQEAVFFFAGDQQGEGDDYDNLGPNETLVVSSPSISGPETSTYTIEAIADGNDEVVESNEGNNSLTAMITVVPRLSWRSTSDAEAPVVDTIIAGQTVYARVEGVPGEEFVIEIWEEDGVGDDKIDTLSVTVGAAGFGTAAWAAAWQGNDGDDPQNEYYLFYDVPFSISNFSSELLEVSVGAGVDLNAFSNPLSYDWGGSGPGEGVIDVVLDRLDSDDPIDPTKQTWVVIHGRNGSFDGTDGNVMQQLAEAVDVASGDDQVITLDWRDGADSPLVTDFFGESWLLPVAQWAMQSLTAYGFTTSLVNLVGHSWGGVISGELAGAFPGGVNTVVAIDPAEDAIPPFGTTYSTNNVTFGGENSSYSWAFYSKDGLGGLAGNEETPTTADEAFVVADSEHTVVVQLVTAMILNPVGSASRFFSLDRLLAMNDGPWQRNSVTENGVIAAESGGYEALILSTDDGTKPLDIDYLNNGPLVADPGDYDQDNDIDGSDFLFWQRSFGATGASLPADGNFTGTVDAGDLQIWRANYGATSSTAINPEVRLANLNDADEFSLVQTLTVSLSVAPTWNLHAAKTKRIDLAIEEYEPTTREFDREFAMQLLLPESLASQTLLDTHSEGVEFLDEPLLDDELLDWVFALVGLL